MKRILYFLFSVLVFSACTEGSTDDVIENNGEQTSPSVNNATVDIKQKSFKLPLEGGYFLVEIEYNTPYKLFFNNMGVIETLKEQGRDKYLLLVNEVDSPTEPAASIRVTDQNNRELNTIYISQTYTSEQLHNGSGNNTSGTVFSCTGGVCSFDVHTNLSDYDIVVFGNTPDNQIKHLRREKTDFGFKEFFEISPNDTSSDQKYIVAFVGDNITYPWRVTVRRQLSINFEEGEELYISPNGETFTVHAWTDDDNLDVRLEGNDTSWLTVKKEEYESSHSINTTFEATPNQTGQTREVSVVAYNGFRDTAVLRIIQPSGETVLLSNENFYVGAWKGSYELRLKKCDYTLSIDGQTSWLTYGEATEKNGDLSIPINVEKYDGDAMREATIVIKSGDITNKVYVRQLPESGALIDDSDPKWKSFQLPEVKFEDPYPKSTGSLLYHAIVKDPKELIAIQSRRVLDLLYFSPDEPLIPRRDAITYKLDYYDGISAFYSGGNSSGIILSNQYVENYYKHFGVKALVAENKGVLSHELTHSFQLSPQGVGDYNTSQVFHACIEGMADAVRVLSGGFPNESDRPKGGSYLDSYRYTGFFIAWLVENKDKDFLRKFNLSTQHVVPWSFDGAIKYALGEQYNVDDLWEEYLRAMGDIQ